MKDKIPLFLSLVLLIISACAPTAAATEAAPIVVSTENPLPVPTQTEGPPQNEPTPSSAWEVVRDPRYGFGLALPCWWIVSPIPAQGLGGVMTITNYDEAYFNAHSTKGFWEWPNGTMKLDLIVMVGVDPAKSDADAYMDFVDQTMTDLVSVAPQEIGAQTVNVLTLKNLVNTSEPDSRLFVYRLAPDKLLMVAPFPQSIVDTPDFQAILASIALTPDEQVSLPAFAPAPALIDASCAQ